MVAENDSKKDTLQTSVQAKKYKVMIVDDEQDITGIFKIGLEKNNSLSLPLVTHRRHFQSSNPSCMTY
jgi:hypothetical protein